MANLSKLIFGAAIAAVTITTPAFAVHHSKPMSAHHNGYGTRSSQGSGVYSVPQNCSFATGIDAQANASSRRLDFVSVCCRSFCGRIEGGFSFGDGWFGVDRLGRRRVDHLA